MTENLRQIEAEKTSQVYWKFLVFLVRTMESYWKYMQRDSDLDSEVILRLL